MIQLEFHRNRSRQTTDASANTQRNVLVIRETSPSPSARASHLEEITASQTSVWNMATQRRRLKLPGRTKRSGQRWPTDGPPRGRWRAALQTWWFSGSGVLTSQDNINTLEPTQEQTDSYALRYQCSYRVDYSFLGLFLPKMETHLGC